MPVEPVVSVVFIIPDAYIAPGEIEPGNVAFWPLNVIAVVIPDLIIKSEPFADNPPYWVPLSNNIISPPSASNLISPGASKVTSVVPFDTISNVVVPPSLIVTLAPSASNTISPPASKVIPPTLEAIEIASVAVPALLVNEIFSLPAVPWGVKIISVAPFLPNFNVWPSANVEPNVIEPEEVSKEISPLVSMSRVVTPDNVVDPVPPICIVAVPSVIVIAFADVNVIAAVASMVTPAPFKSKAPVVVISTSLEFPAILTPPLPSSVSAPEDVVKLLAPVESKLIAPVVSIVIPPVPASISNVVPPVALPNVIVLAAVPEPMLIAPVTASLPTLIDPPEELKDIFPVESKSSVVAPDNVVAPVPPICIVAVPSVIVIAFADVNVIVFVASIVTPAPFKSNEPVVVISISAAFPAILIPAAPFNVNAPDDVVKLEAPAASIAIPPLPASNSIAIAFTSTFVDESLPTVMVLAEAPEPILIAPVTASSPTFIEPPEELKDIFPVESKSSVVAPDNVVAPVPPICIVAVPSVNVNAFTEVIVNANASIVTAVLSAEPRANVPEPCGSMVILELLADVVISIAPAESNVKPPVPASNSISIAFISIFVDESLPTVIVLAEAPEPILIAPVTASSPTLMAPVDELRESAPVESKSSVVAPDILVAPVPPICIVAVPSVIVIAFVDVNVIVFVASIVTAAPFKSKAPVVVISISAAFPAIFTPAAPSSVNAPAEVVILEAAAALNVKPPAEAVNAIASVAVPAVLVNETFSLLAVPWGENTISVAPFLPNLSVWPSANAEPINILPAVALIETASLPVPSDDNNNDESPPPVTARVKSLALPPPVVTVTFVASVPSIDTVEPSKVNAPELISTAPVVVISISAAFPWIFTPPLPSSVNAPEDVVIFEAAPASKLIPFVASIVTSIPAFKSKLPAVAVIAIASELFPAVLTNEIFSLPAVPWGENIISVAPFLPNFNVCPSANVEPKLIEPVEVSTVTSPLVSTSSVVTPDNVVAPLPFIANVAAPSVNVNAALAVVNVMVEPESIVVAPVTSISKIPASISTIEPAFASASICNATPAPCADIKLIWPSSEFVVNVISSAASIVTLSPAFKSKLPAVAVIEIASAAVPDVLVKEIFSLPAVPWGENTISVAPFLPNFNVCPSDKIAPIVIELETESIVTAPVASTSKPVEPLCLIITSLSTPILIWEPSLFNETFAPKDAS